MTDGFQRTTTEYSQFNQYGPTSLKISEMAIWCSKGPLSNHPPLRVYVIPNGSDMIVAFPSDGPRGRQAVPVPIERCTDRGRLDSRKIPAAGRLQSRSRPPTAQRMRSDDVPPSLPSLLHLHNLLHKKTLHGANPFGRLMSVSPVLCSCRLF
ncbi:uncharacterized protein CIMG_03481 [Coccidioides immitis RS]|uniref:Uncharacterized protein n=3 Tax=Coccidioides immitis TaxID=5501 RepID=J3KBG4_COCIM|nr:uncharacterized protein CIMG_03481 [Coccidioides immitis RS]EAS32457.3 hypothetical protein CIMG_03481 [Coccidioides immitis RS]KMP07694.1 hypothetical protein CIRG_07375 [Coccidioides immitis RMSCC 2394]KMU82781.1 hypothetical protein CIHG_00564 [Coccidioides immitis H538.4]